MTNALCVSWGSPILEEGQEVLLAHVEGRKESADHA